MIRIVVVDDHAAVRNGLCFLLSRQQDMKVVGSAKNGEAAMELITNGLETDIVLTDLSMTSINGLELTSRLLKLGRFRIIILTISELLIVKQLALNAGAKECLSKYDDPEGIPAAIRAVHAA